MATASEQNPDIANFLAKNHTAVLATSHKETGQPHAAVIYYTFSSSFNLFFVTKKDTAKSRNIESNPQVALAVYEAHPQKTVQITGTAEPVDDPEKLQKALVVMAHHSQKGADTPVTPISRLDAGDYVLYKITPSNIRMADYKYSAIDNVFEAALPKEESLE